MTTDNIAQAPSPTTYCEKHPDRPTGLRCNRCGRLICAQCAVLTPTGYRCEDCVKQQRKVYDTAFWYDYVTAFVAAGVLSYVGALIVARIGFFTLLLAPAAGGVIAEAVRLVVRKRRAKRLFQLAIAGLVVGALPQILLPLLYIASGNFGVSFSLLWQVLYIAMAAPTAYYRLSGIQIGR